jgi:hypothetical protein
VQVILALNPPNNVKELRHFLRMVQYYWDMWARRSEMLAPLTDLVGECKETKTSRISKTKKKPLQWDPIHQQAFDNVKAAIAKETVLAYPDLSKPFEIYTDASSTQLGAMITQDNRPIAFFSRKLSKTQQKYSVTEIELLAIVKTLKSSRGCCGGSMRTTIRSLTKSFKSCQINKRRSQKYGHLPPKIVYTIPWECLCVDLIGPHTPNSLTDKSVLAGEKLVATYSIST